MNKKNGTKQVSLAGVAKTQKPKKKVSPWKWIGVVAGMLALLVVGVMLFTAFDEEEKPSEETPEAEEE